MTDSPLPEPYKTAQSYRYRIRALENHPAPSHSQKAMTRPFPADVAGDGTTAASDGNATRWDRAARSTFRHTRLTV